MQASIGRLLSLARPCLYRTLSLSPRVSATESPEADVLYKQVDIEVRSHDDAVLKSYMTFLKTTTQHLELDCDELPVPDKTARWLQTVVSSAFAKGKKGKVQYEVITHITAVSVKRVTGSTTSTLLEYLQRNLPEGVAMKVTTHELAPIPQHLLELERKTIQDSQ